MLIGVMLLFIRVLTYAGVSSSSFASAGGVDTVYLDASAEWSVTPGEIASAEYIGNGAVVVSVGGNPGLTERIDTVIASSANIVDTILVTQAGDPYILITDPVGVSMTYGYGGVLDTILVSSNVPWAASLIDHVWGASESLTSKGDTVFISLPANTTGGYLSDTLLLSVYLPTLGTTVSARLQLSQEPLPELSVSDELRLLEYGYAGNRDTFTIESNVLWDYEQLGSLAEVYRNPGVGEDILYIYVGENRSLKPLYDTIVVYTTELQPSVSDTIYIVQSAFEPLLLLPSEVPAYGANGIVDTLLVSANVEWLSLPGSASWSTIEKSDTLLIVTLQANTELASRVDTLIVLNAEYDISDTLIITQSGLEPAYALSVKELTLSAALGSVDTIYLTSNAEWSAIKSAEWLNVSPVSGSGEVDTLIVSALSKNEASELRVDTIYISGLGGYADTILVYQGVVEPDGVSISVLDEADAVVPVKGKLKLVASVTPVDAVDKSVRWESLDESKATVVSVIESSESALTGSEIGEVSGISIGEVAIVVSTEVGGYSDTLSVSVTAETGITSVSGGVSVSLVGGVLRVTSPVSESLYVYTPSGILLSVLSKGVGESVYELNLPSGVLIIKGSSGWSRKIIRAISE
jgi:hypothetical protein